MAEANGTTPAVRIDDGEPRDSGRSMWRGFRGRCPHCGEGKLFARFLRVAPACDVCGEKLEGHRADDLPAYVVIFLVGHIVVALNLVAERGEEWPLWVHFALWPTLALVLTLVLLQPTKGALIGLQWAMRLHGYDPAGDHLDRPSRLTGQAS